MAGATADGTGTTPAFEVVPSVRSGATVGATVELVTPVLKAVIVPGSVREGTMARSRRNGIAFDWIQTLR